MVISAILTESAGEVARDTTAEGGTRSSATMLFRRVTGERQGHATKAGSCSRHAITERANLAMARYDDMSVERAMIMSGDKGTTECSSDVQECQQIAREGRHMP